jgi:hypothetical protein
MRPSPSCSTRSTRRRRRGTSPPGRHRAFGDLRRLLRPPGVLATLGHRAHSWTGGQPSSEPLLTGWAPRRGGGASRDAASRCRRRLRPDRRGSRRRDVTGTGRSQLGAQVEWWSEIAVEEVPVGLERERGRVVAHPALQAQHVHAGRRCGTPRRNARHGDRPPESRSAPVATSSVLPRCPPCCHRDGFAKGSDPPSRAKSESAPDRIRTCDLRFRRPTLYPAELRARVDPEDSGRAAGAASRSEASGEGGIRTRDGT